MHTFRGCCVMMLNGFIHGSFDRCKTWDFKGYPAVTMAWDLVVTQFSDAYPAREPLQASAPGVVIVSRCMDASMPAAPSLTGSSARHVANSTHRMNVWYDICALLPPAAISWPLCVYGLHRNPIMAIHR